MFSRIFKQVVVSAAIVSSLGSCSTLKQLGLVPNNFEIVTALKDALEQGMFKSLDALGDPNSGNPLVKFAFPGNAAEIQQKLNALGLSSLLNNFTAKYSRAIGDAVSVAKPMFVNSIRKMSISDAYNILITDNPHAATDYFKNVNQSSLMVAFRPIVDSTVRVDKLDLDWQKITSVYNLIPIQKPSLEKNLSDFISARVIDGMFAMIATEEENIRTKYEFRKTDIMKKVFTYAEQQVKYNLNK